MKTIELYDIEQPMIIVVDETSPVIYSNQVGGCQCLDKKERGYLIPIQPYKKEEYLKLFDPGSNYLNFNFKETKNLYKDFLETNPWYDIKNVIIDEENSEEAWILFNFTSFYLFRQEESNIEEYNKLDAQKQEIDRKAFLDYLGFRDNPEMSLSKDHKILQFDKNRKWSALEEGRKQVEELFAPFKSKSDHRYYTGILTWQNSD